MMNSIPGCADGFNKILANVDWNLAWFLLFLSFFIDYQYHMYSMTMPAIDS